MPFVGNPTVAMVELRYNFRLQQCENTLYFDLGAEPTPESLATLAENIAIWWDTNMQPLLTGQIALAGIKCTSLAAEDAPAFEYTGTLPHFGTTEGDSPPNSVSFVVKFVTGGRGRSGRGRNYIMGFPTAQVVENELNSSYIADIIDAYEALGSSPVTSSGVHVVYSRFHDGAPRGTGLAQNVTGYTFTDQVVDSQRRRLPGRGT